MTNQSTPIIYIWRSKALSRWGPGTVAVLGTTASDGVAAARDKALAFSRVYLEKEEPWLFQQDPADSVEALRNFVDALTEDLSSDPTPVNILFMPGSE